MRVNIEKNKIVRYPVPGDYFTDCFVSQKLLWKYIFRLLLLYSLIISISILIIFIPICRTLSGKKITLIYYLPTFPGIRVKSNGIKVQYQKTNGYINEITVWQISHIVAPWSPDRPNRWAEILLSKFAQAAPPWTPRD